MSEEFIEELEEVLDGHPGGHIGCDGCSMNGELAHLGKSVARVLCGMVWDHHEGSCWAEDLASGGIAIEEDACGLCRLWVEYNPDRRDGVGG